MEKKNGKSTLETCKGEKNRIRKMKKKKTTIHLLILFESERRIDATNIVCQQP